MRERLRLTRHFRKKFGLSWLTAWQSARWEVFYNKQEGKQMTEDDALNFGDAMTDSFIRGFRDGKETERDRIIEVLEKFEAFGRDVITSEYITTEELIAIIAKEKK